MSLLNHPAQTALHFTASKSHLPTARKLLARNATARVKDKRQQLPLHRAAAVGSVPMIKLLIEHSSPLNATDVSGQTALHHGKRLAVQPNSTVSFPFQEMLHGSTPGLTRR